MIMNRMNFRKASSICMAVTMACLQMQPLTALPALAEEGIILDEEMLEAKNEAEVSADDVTEDEDTNSEVTEEETEEEVSDLEDCEDEIESDEVGDAQDEDSEVDEEAEEAELETAGATVKALSGSLSSKLSQLKQQFPADRYWNHKVTAEHDGYKQVTRVTDPCNNPEGTTNHPCDTHDVFSSSSSLKDPKVGGYSCNFFDNGIQCSGYARTIFYKLHGKRASSFVPKKPTSINDIAVGDFVHLSGKKTSNHDMVVTSVNTSKKTITGTDANNNKSCRISWNSSFSFSEVAYVISPSNPVAGILPEDDTYASTFAHDFNRTKSYTLHFDTSADKATARQNNVTCYYRDNVYIPEDIVTRPGYLVAGWKIQLPSGQIIKSKSFTGDYGFGTANENGGVDYGYKYGGNEEAVFNPGNAFWAKDGVQGATFTLIPQWEADPNYQAPTPPSNPTTPTQPADPANPFDDVKKGDWYYDWVVKSNAAGLMTGLNSTHFGPNDKMSRAMVATVLYRMAGSPNISDTQIFPDVPAGQWYSKAIKWANEKKVATGYENGKFGPDDNITREQLATMICRYQRNVAGKSTSDKASLDKFPDKKNVNDFARESVQYCVAKGIITGSHGHLLPVDNATRAECAKMLLVAKDAK